MKKKFFLAAVLFCSSAFIMKAQLSQQPATIKLAAASLMHEMRATLFLLLTMQQLGIEKYLFNGRCKAIIT